MTRVLVALALVVLVALVTWIARRTRERLESPREVADLPRLEPGLHATDTATWVVFTTEFCTTCKPTADRLRADHPEDRVVTIDVAARPDLARRYDIRRAPTVMHVGRDGTVLGLDRYSARSRLSSAAPPQTRTSARRGFDRSRSESSGSATGQPTPTSGSSHATPSSSSGS